VIHPASSAVEISKISFGLLNQLNSLALRITIDKKSLIKEFIQAVGQEVVEAQFHQDLPFEKLVEIESFNKNMTKSQKEFNSIKLLMSNLDMDDDTWVIKLSGRYMIYNDIFIESVKNASDNIKAVIRTCDNDTQMYTFLFALRFKYFKEYFVNYNLPDNINLERITLLYIKNILSSEEIQCVNDLGIICNISDCNVYTYF
jgi:hypothetical protein